MSKKLKGIEKQEDSRGNKGFTLIELIVIIAIIGILSSIVLASLSTARAKNCVQNHTISYCEKQTGRSRTDLNEMKKSLKEENASPDAQVGAADTPCNK